MKKTANLIKFALIFLLFVGWNLTAMAQAGSPPPPPGGGHGQGGNQPAGNGGGAPIGSGMAILLSLGAAWGGKKVYQAYKVRE